MFNHSVLERLISEENGYKLTGHYVEEGLLCAQIMCCGGIMPFYEYEHIPGIDWLGRRLGNNIAMRQVASVAAQLGKEQVMSEMYGCCGWDVTPKELKSIAECQYVGGINLMCQLLLPYKEHGQRKRDYPAHFSHWNPWVNKGFKEFNDYFSLLGKTLAWRGSGLSSGFALTITLYSRNVIRWIKRRKNCSAPALTSAGAD